MNKDSAHKKSNSETRFWKHFAVELAEFYIDIRNKSHTPVIG